MSRYYVTAEIRAYVTADHQNDAYAKVMAAIMNRSDESPGDVDIRGSDPICVTQEEDTQSTAPTAEGKVI